MTPIDLHRGPIDEKSRIISEVVPSVLSPECIVWTVIGGGMACALLTSAEITVHSSIGTDIYTAPIQPVNQFSFVRKLSNTAYA